MYRACDRVFSLIDSITRECERGSYIVIIVITNESFGGEIGSPLLLLLALARREIWEITLLKF